MPPSTWHHAVLRIALWLAAEVVLNCYGLDNLADYSEYVFEPRPTAIVVRTVAIRPHTPT